AAKRLSVLFGCFVFVVDSWSASQAERPQPGRVVTAYALTSAHNEEGQDPSAWRLLGSNDGERSWIVLDAQTNQLFTARCQRSVFTVRNLIAYNIYSLQVFVVELCLGSHLDDVW